MPLPRRRLASSAEQPALPLDLGAEGAPSPRPRRTRPRHRREEPVQLAFDGGWEPGLERQGGDEPEETAAPLSAAPPEPEPSSRDFAGEEEFEVEPPAFDPDPFAAIPGFARAVSVAREFVVLPGSLRGRLDLREFSRFLASLPTVVRDWEGAPEIEDGGIRLTGAEGGAWVYPEGRRVRLVTDGDVGGPVAEDLVALCRWLDSRAGMRLYPAGEAAGAGTDRSLDPWETFLG